MVHLKRGLPMNMNTCDPEKLSLSEKIKLVRETDGLLIDILNEEIIEVSLSLNHCTSLTHLPENLKVERDLYLMGCTSLIHLPNNLKINGSLWLMGCTSLIYFSDNLKIGEHLYLDGCTSLKSIPDSIKVGGDIYLPDHLRHKTGRKDD